jgi:uncharacterized membrane protein YdjX (TVP38/TMEM64 family)
MLKQLLPWAAIIALTIITHFINPAFFPQAWLLIKSGSIEEIVEYLRSFGAWTALMSILVNIIINLSGVLPTVIISGANGILFGLPLGIAISWIGECLGTVIAFVLWRSLLRIPARRLIHHSSYLTTVDEFSGKRGFRAMLLARLVPLAPSGLITILGAVSSISFSDMLWATLIGKLPSIALEVVLGHDIAFAADNKLRLGILLVIVLVSFLYFWRKHRHPDDAAK